MLYAELPPRGIAEGLAWLKKLSLSGSNVRKRALVSLGFRMKDGQSNEQDCNATMCKKSRSIQHVRTLPSISNFYLCVSCARSCLQIFQWKLNKYNARIIECYVCWYRIRSLIFWKKKKTLFHGSNSVEKSQNLYKIWRNDALSCNSNKNGFVTCRIHQNLIISKLIGNSHRSFAWYLLSFSRQRFVKQNFSNARIRNFQLARCYKGWNYRVKTRRSFPTSRET